MRRLRPFEIVTATAAALLLLSACGQGETRDEGGEIVTGGDTDVFSLQVGDCFDDESLEQTEISSVPTVPCSDPHDNEVYAEYTFPEGDFPGADVVEQTAMDECLAQWESFVGIPYDQMTTTLEVFPIYPLQAGWEGADDRLVTCAIWDKTGEKVTGTLAGAAR